MKLMIIATLLALTAVSCTSAKKREECKVTCMEKNAIYDDVERHGCLCVEKEDPAKRQFDDVDLD